MKDRHVSYCALILSIMAMVYAGWVHARSAALAARAVADREARLISYIAPRLKSVSIGFGLPENTVPTSAKTLEELIGSFEAGMNSALGNPNGTNTLK